MADNKKYYYLKLKDNFFDSDEMIVLESMIDGYKYSNILMKLYLRSLKGEGKLMFNDRIPFNSQMLATITRHSVGDVEKAVKLFKELNLIDVLDNGAIYMLDIQNFIGESSTEADRIRAYRKRIETDKNRLEMGACTSVQDNVYICTPELELELEIEKELEIEIDKDNVEQSSPSYPYSEIIDYLNLKAGTKYRATSKKTQGLIKARFKEGFDIDDFKTVIDKKTTEWKNDKKMNQYLRPETLFGTKFEGYLNQKIVNLPVESKANVIPEAHDEKPPEVEMSEEERVALIERIRQGLDF